MMDSWFRNATGRRNGNRKIHLKKNELHSFSNAVEKNICPYCEKLVLLHSEIEAEEDVFLSKNLLHVSGPLAQLVRAADS